MKREIVYQSETNELLAFAFVGFGFISEGAECFLCGLGWDLGFGVAFRWVDLGFSRAGWVCWLVVEENPNPLVHTPKSISFIGIPSSGRSFQ